MNEEGDNGESVGSEALSLLSFTLPLFVKVHVTMCVFIITDKAKLVGEEVKGVGVMKDEKRKLEEIEVSHTLGG